MRRAGAIESTFFEVASEGVRVRIGSGEMVDREGKIAMYFAPDPQHRYSDLEGMRQDEQHFRTLSIAGRPAFLIDEHNPRGSRGLPYPGFSALRRGDPVPGARRPDPSGLSVA